MLDSAMSARFLAHQKVPHEILYHLTIQTTLRILGLSMAGVGPSIAGVRALKTLSV